MAIRILRPEERGSIENKVFKGQTLFSNGMRNTPRAEAFGTVYVFNDDVLRPESFLGMHPHQNVEIVTIMISGTESHRDTLGVHEDYNAGDVQLISSGTGLQHEGGNISSVEDARHLQIWIAPRALNLEPKVSAKTTALNKNSLSLLVSPNAAQESLQITQEVWVYQGQLELGQKIVHNLHSLGNGVMVYLVKGALEINATLIPEGGTAFITDENIIELISEDQDSYFVLIETIM